MKYVIIIFAIVGLFTVGNFASVTKDRALIGDPLGYEDAVRVNYNHRYNTCSTGGEFFDFTVSVVYVNPAEAIDYLGQYNEENKTISLNTDGGLKVGIVAHEVFHMVEHVMDEYKVADPHYGPYLQGVFTSCVWGLVEQDLIDAGVLQVFRFAQ